jgi:hypothetical protein
LWGLVGASIAFGSLIIAIAAVVSWWWSFGLFLEFIPIVGAYNEYKKYIDS